MTAWSTFPVQPRQRGHIIRREQLSVGWPHENRRRPCGIGNPQIRVPLGVISLAPLPAPMNIARLLRPYRADKMTIYKYISTIGCFNLRIPTLLEMLSIAIKVLRAVKRTES